MTQAAVRFSRVLRTWILIGAVVQAALPGVVGILDASAAGSDAAAAIRPHIESHGTPKCPRVHQEDNCALCQFVSASAAPTSHAPSFAIVRTTSHAVVKASIPSPAWLSDGSPSLPRAPPIAG